MDLCSLSRHGRCDGGEWLGKGFPIEFTSSEGHLHAKTLFHSKLMDEIAIKLNSAF